jgi:hypothetical protein
MDQIDDPVAGLPGAVDQFPVVDQTVINAVIFRFFKNVRGRGEKYGKTKNTVSLFCSKRCFSSSYYLNNLLIPRSFLNLLT